MLIIAISIALMAACLDGAVLDPSLYLAPSPPLMETSDSIPPGELWMRPLEAMPDRVAREAVETTTQPPEKLRAVETGRMFWPLNNKQRDINIPLTFSLSGSYGNPGIAPSGVIGKTYTSLTGLPILVSTIVSKPSREPSGTLAIDLGSGLGSSQSSLRTASLYGGYGKSALAGSSYGSYGIRPSVRVYGGDTAASWGGWGNGKWGHYGKG